MLKTRILDTLLWLTLVRVSAVRTDIGITKEERGRKI
jgi:hypothetical protein